MEEITQKINQLLLILTHGPPTEEKLSFLLALGKGGLRICTVETASFGTILTNGIIFFELPRESPIFLICQFRMLKANPSGVTDRVL